MNFQKFELMFIFQYYNHLFTTFNDNFDSNLLRFPSVNIFDYFVYVYYTMYNIHIQCLPIFMIQDIVHAAGNNQH